MNAPVDSCAIRYAGEGQTALTFVLHSIKYGAGASAGLPSSVAIKIHAESAAQREASAEILLYDKEIYFYTKLLDSVPVKTPRPLAIWTDGPDGTDANAPAIKFFALMMEDMSLEHDVFDATCLNPDRTMCLDQIRTVNKQQVLIHVRCNAPFLPQLQAPCCHRSLPSLLVGLGLADKDTVSLLVSVATGQILELTSDRAIPNGMPRKRTSRKLPLWPACTRRAVEDA